MDAVESYTGLHKNMAAKYKLTRGSHIHNGKTFKVGDEVPLTENQFKSFRDRFEPIGKEEKKSEKSEFDSYKVDELKDALEALEVEIPEGAKKADLVELLEEHSPSGDE